MQGNPFILIVIVIGLCTTSSHASVRDDSESSSPLSSSSKQSNASGSVSAHPNHVTYPELSRKAKLDDGAIGSDDSRPSGNNNNGNDSKNSISLNPIAKASTDTGSFAVPALSSASSSSLNASKTRCDRPKRPHSGVLIKPSSKSYAIGQTVVFQCHNGISVTAFCEEGGQWSRGPPHCPPTNQSCPPLVFENGNVTFIGATADNPRPLQSRAIFKCNDGYDLVGAPSLVCDKGFVWSYRTPACLPQVAEEKPSSSSFLAAVLLAIAIVFSLVVVAAGSLWYRWWRRKLQRDQWKRLFGNYTYRQSKRKIAVPSNMNASHQEMKQFKAAAAVIPSTEL